MRYVSTVLFGVFVLFAAPPCLSAVEPECAKCHAPLLQKKVVHAPMHEGCAVCHPGLTPEVPHRKAAGANAAGAGALATVPCSKCHESASFEGKSTHAPVSAGKCQLCHDAHSSDHAGLLTKDPAVQCLECHAEVAKGPHVIAGFSQSGHPLGADAKSRKAEDPLRPGRKFYCVSCHEPHRSDLPKLGRFPKGISAACQSCHKI